MNEHIQLSVLKREDAFKRMFDHFYNSMGFLGLDSDFAYLGSWYHSSDATGNIEDIFHYCEFELDKPEEEIREFWRYSKKRISQDQGREAFIPEYLSVALYHKNSWFDTPLMRFIYEDVRVQETWADIVQISGENAELILSIVFGAVLAGQCHFALDGLAWLSHCTNIRQLVRKDVFEVLAYYMIPAISRSHDKSVAKHADSVIGAFHWLLSNGDIYCENSLLKKIETLRFCSPSASIAPLQPLQELLESHIQRIADSFEREVLRNASDMQKDEALLSVRNELKGASNETIEKILLAGELVWKRLEHDSDVAGDLSGPIVQYAKAAESAMSQLWDAIVNRDDKGQIWNVIEYAAKEEDRLYGLGKLKERHWSPLFEEAGKMAPERRGELLKGYVGTATITMEKGKKTGLQKTYMLNTLLKCNKQFMSPVLLVVADNIDRVSTINRMKDLMGYRNGYAHSDMIDDSEPDHAKEKIREVRQLSFQIVHTVICCINIVTQSAE